ncbi:hypothetical protein [Sneathiella limimaris]|uniref:hypothetical protein n=1 Tax=Sneathiella limimaris TaxID=1964213 RepID=UPI00146DA48E|nr:hypothetical protein [Sneathiella limimaris]
MKKAIPSYVQLSYLFLGFDQPGGKLPLFDRDGQQIKAATIRSCIKNGWAEPWFENPIKKDWLVCKLTEAGFALLEEHAPTFKEHSLFRDGHLIQ